MLRESEYVKLRIVAPVENADAIRAVLAEVGAGRQGNYTHCTGSYPQTGRFKPETGAHPAVGEVGNIAIVNEEIIETLCHRDLVVKVIDAVKKVHPYEEPAIDIIPRLEVE